ncbi:MAG TPA: response regulator [Terracidiphilus sp.]|nr:response regulator [Terracidiphilus sp.]
MRVLVVDDEHVVADSLALILKARGFEARAIYSGEDAAELALTWKPDAVISDVVMGKMDGVALAIYLARTLPSCKVLLISGNIATEQLINESKKQGHDFPILAKPFRPESIFEFFGLTGLVGNA